MKNTTIFVLLVCVGVLTLFLYSQNTALREQRRQVQELNAKLESMSKTTSLDLQGKCAKQAQEAFKLNGMEKEAMASFQNHYNTKLNKCFVQFNSHKGLMTFRTVVDAFEGKDYADYAWQADKVKKYWEVPPFVCRVTLLSGEEKTCRSSDEFDALVKLYME